MYKIKNTELYYIQFNLLKGEKIIKKKYKIRGGERAKADWKKKLDYYRKNSPYKLIDGILYNKSRNKVIHKYKIINGTFI